MEASPFRGKRAWPINSSAGSRWSSSRRSKHPVIPKFAPVAGIYAPRLRLGGPAALGFAATNALRASLIAETIRSPVCAVASNEETNEETKSMHFKRVVHCAERGIHSVPFVAEADSGVWELRPQQLWLDVARSIATISSRDPAALHHST